MIQHLLVNTHRRTFQNRARHIEDDGADFETFVFECFRYAKEEAGFVRRLARGRDGSIDLLDRFGEPGATTVAECKYIGSASAKEAAARWGDVAARLRAHLPPLAADPAKNPLSPYRGWLDPERPVTRYRFCVTAEMTDEQVAALEREIAGVFAELVATEGVTGLAELAANKEGNVRVLRWDWFAAELDAHPSLNFRWFRGLPVGVELFDPQTGTRATFRDFLGSGELRYFSRDEYSDLRIGIPPGGEGDLASSLAEGDVQALLISGPGGVGKTRLSWELSAALADRGKGFDVYSLGRGAGFGSIAELAALYPADASILLLFDYAEAARSLGEVADAVEHLAANSGHRIRLLATCRSSATNAVRDALGVLQVREKSLGSDSTGELDYSDWVARSILGLENLPGRREIEQVCRGVPALAAFALFLYRRHRSRFDVQFGALHGVADFDRWAAHRISALVGRTSGRDPTAERTLALLALSLPMPLEDYGQFEATHRALVGALRDDRWIEQEDDNYVAAHDVLADSLAARWLFESENAATDRVRDLLVETASRGWLERGLVVMERLASYPKFNSINGSRVIALLVDRHLDQVARSLRLLLSGSLLSFGEKLDLLHNSEILKRKACEDRGIDAPLSSLAEHAAKQMLSPSALPSLATLLHLLDHALSNEQGSNMILRRAYALDPPRFRERAFQSIRHFPGSEPTHFLLVQMLKTGENIVTLESAVRYWAHRNSTAPRASFLYRAWLERDGSIEAIEKSLLAWLAEHGTSTEAQFVYKAWLDADAPIEGVERPLLAWLAEHGNSIGAQFVYAPWLDADGSVDAVEKQLFAWLAVHGTSPVASHVYKAWLDRDGSIEAIEKSLLAWLAEHGTSTEAQFVYDAWLDAHGSIDAIEKPLIAWLAEHGTSTGASHVYKAWLDAGGCIDTVEKPLLAWLAEHGTAIETQFVYKAWLDADGPIDAVEKPLLAWLAEHGSSIEAQFVYTAWLDAKGSLDAVEKPLLAWLAQHGTVTEAQFVYNSWLDADGSVDAVEKPLRAWLAEHGTTSGANHVYKAWLDADGSTDAVEKPILAWLAEHGTEVEADHVYRAWLEADGDFERVRQQVFAWALTWKHEHDFVYLSKNLAKRSDLPDPVSSAIIDWCIAYAEDDDAIWRLSQVCKGIQASSASTLLLTRVAHSALILLRRRSEKQGLSPLDRALFWQLIVYGIFPNLYNASPDLALNMAAEIIRTGAVFVGRPDTAGLALAGTEDQLAYIVLLCLKRGFLDSTRDKASLEKMVEWLRRSSGDRMSRLIQRIEEERLGAAGAGQAPHSR